MCRLWLARGSLGAALLFSSRPVQPGAHIYFKYLDRFVTRRGWGGVAVKVGLEAVLPGPFFIVAFFLYRASVIERQPLSVGVTSVKQNFYHTWIDWFKFWPAAQTINYAFVPLQKRVLFLNCGSFMWNTYLCLAASKTAQQRTVTRNSDGVIPSSIQQHAVIPTGTGDS